MGGYLYVSYYTDCIGALRNFTHGYIFPIKRN